MTAPVPRQLLSDIRTAKRGGNADKKERTARIIEQFKLSTVCEAAACPNIGECFSKGTSAFLILGDICTRGCAFCAVSRGNPSGFIDADEPERLAQAALELKLDYAVITSVTRDDLPDGGAGHYAKVLRALKETCPDLKVEILVPDFRGSEKAIATALCAQPDVFAHNIETVQRLYPLDRKGASYVRSLKVLRKAKEISKNIITKSSLMLGLGEKPREIERALRDLRRVGCDILTLGQYISPSAGHAPVIRYLSRGEFDSWRDLALREGFIKVMAHPLARSSYKAAALSLSVL